MTAFPGILVRRERWIHASGSDRQHNDWQRWWSVDRRHLDYNWLLGAQKAFYIGLGLGAKTLFISDKDVADEATLHYPTMRLSVGWAF